LAKEVNNEALNDGKTRQREYVKHAEEGELQVKLRPTRHAEAQPR
jgi:hypothetical protein